MVIDSLNDDRAIKEETHGNKGEKTMIKPGMFSKNVAADNMRLTFDFYNEQLLSIEKKPDLLFIGDSITQLWDLNVYFGSGLFIVNRGIGGDCSTYLLKRFIADCIQLNPKKVVLMIGTNDISRTNNDLWWRTMGEDEVTVLDDYKKNITEIVKLCDDNKIDIVLCSIIPSDIVPPYDKEIRWKMTSEMNVFLKSLGKMYVDYHHNLTSDNKTLIYELSPDGIHVNAKGYEIMARVLQETLDMQ